MDRLADVPDWLNHAVLSPLAQMAILDQALQPLQSDLSKPPAAAGWGWVDQLTWGVDSGIAVARLLLCGQFVGAATIARSQLERWTRNRAFLAGITRTSDERPHDYIARVWSAPVDLQSVPDAPAFAAAFEADDSVVAHDPDIDHTHLRFSDDREVCPALTWMILSEILHGRGFGEAVAWDSQHCLDPDLADTAVEMSFTAVIDAIRVCWSHLRRVLAAIHLEEGSTSMAAALRDALDGFSQAEEGTPEGEPPRIAELAHDSGLTCPPLYSLIPLTPGEGLNPHVAALMSSWCSKYAGVLARQRPDGRLYRDDEVASLGFAWHRASSINAAIAALQAEKRRVGNAFSLRVLHNRVTRWIFVSEALALCGSWEPLPQPRAAGHAAASALRSACWLWLEDDDRAMAVARSVLEQVTRLRAWRLKPDKAAKTEASVASPQRWLEAAGWRRLGPLNLAFGEFSHATSNSDPERGRTILNKIQSNPDPELAPFTARGNALWLVQELAAREAVERILSLAPMTGAALRQILSEVGPDLIEDSELERRLTAIWQLAQAERDAEQTSVSST